MIGSEERKSWLFFSLPPAHMISGQWHAIKLFVVGTRVLPPSAAQDESPYYEHIMGEKPDMISPASLPCPYFLDQRIFF